MLIKYSRLILPICLCIAKKDAINSPRFHHPTWPRLRNAITRVNSVTFTLAILFPDPLNQVLHFYFQPLRSYSLNFYTFFVPFSVLSDSSLFQHFISRHYTFSHIKWTTFCFLCLGRNQINEQVPPTSCTTILNLRYTLICTEYDLFESWLWSIFNLENNAYKTTYLIGCTVIFYDG